MIFTLQFTTCNSPIFCFVWAVCHELRNPLHVLKSNVAFLLAAKNVNLSASSSLAPKPHAVRLGFCSDTSRALSWSESLTLAGPGLSPTPTGAASTRLSVVSDPVHWHDSDQAWSFPIGPGDGRSSGGLQVDVDGDSTKASTGQLQVECQPQAELAVQEIAADVMAAIDRMEGTVNDVLDFRKLDANMFAMTTKPTALLPLLDSICRHCRSFLAPSVDFGYRVRPSPAVVMIDSRRVFQIITNGLRCRIAAMPVTGIFSQSTVIELLSERGQRHKGRVAVLLCFVLPVFNCCSNAGKFTDHGVVTLDVVISQDKLGDGRSFMSITSTSALILLES